MSEKSKLKLQLPSHHVYDFEEWSTEAFEAPSGLISNNPNFSGGPVQRRKTSKSMRNPGVTDPTKIVVKDTKFMVPQTPPTPDNNAALYPFLRLHRQLSTSAPDVSKSVDKDRKSNVNRVDIEAHFYNNNGENKQQRSLTQPNFSNDGQNLSESVLQQGLTAAYTNIATSGDKRQGNEESQKPYSTPRMGLAASENKNDNNNHHQSTLPKRPSNGFLTSLIFGDNLFNGKPLKVSGFDMSMCAPGSM